MKKWVTSTLPDERETVIATIILPGMTTRTIDTARVIDGEWRCSCEALLGFSPTVVAWRPFPKPYKGEEVLEV